MNDAGGQNGPRIATSRGALLVRRRLFPIVVWLGAVGALLYLAQQRSSYVGAVGIVETREVAVSPLTDGTLRSLRVDLFDTITEGEVVAMMDDTLVKAELMVAEAELSHLRARLAAESRLLEMQLAETARSELDDLRRYIMNEEEARLDYLDMLVQYESDKVELERLAIQMNRQKELVENAIGDVQTYDDLRLEYEALRKSIEETEAALDEARRHADMAARRREERESNTNVNDSSPVSDYLAPLRGEIDIQRARIQAVQDQSLTLILRAPMTGHVAQILHKPGETVLSGDPLLTIRAQRAERVVAYLDEKTAHHVRPGSEAVLSSRRTPSVTAVAKVIRTGTGLEEMPPRLWQTPLIPQWGRPVLIGGLPEGLFLPGETINVRLKAATD